MNAQIQVLDRPSRAAFSRRQPNEVREFIDVLAGRVRHAHDNPSAMRDEKNTAAETAIWDFAEMTGIVQPVDVVLTSDSPEPQDVFYEHIELRAVPYSINVGGRTTAEDLHGYDAELVRNTLCVDITGDHEWTPDPVRTCVDVDGVDEDCRKVVCWPRSVEVRGAKRVVVYDLELES